MLSPFTVLCKPAFIMEKYGWLIRISHHLLVKSVKTTIIVGVETICHMKFIHFCTVLLTLTSPIPSRQSTFRCPLQGLKTHLMCIPILILFLIFINLYILNFMQYTGNFFTNIPSCRRKVSNIVNKLKSDLLGGLSWIGCSTRFVIADSFTSGIPFVKL